MGTVKIRTLLKAFGVSHFNYCPLLVDVPQTNLNNQINSLHEKT